MNNNERIDEFLKFFRDIALQNSIAGFTDKNVYHSLTRLGVPEHEKNTRINSLFPDWINYFLPNPNCRVFVDPSWAYFCQFISNDRAAKRADEHLKVYIPLDAAHIKQGAVMIFDFLSREGISHLSKIGSDVRFDDIVVRLINPEDLKKLTNFIKNNSYIQEGLLPANPFLFNLDGIAMAVDGKISYNSTVATLIQLYINQKISSQSLGTVGVDDFYAFVENYYNYVFSSSQGLYKLTADFNTGGYNTSEYQFLNYKNVIELILKSHKKNFTFEDYIAHFQQCSNPFIQRQKADQLYGVLNNRQVSVAAITVNPHSLEELSKKTNDMLFQLIDGMTEKYSNQYEVLNNISKYINTGREDYITRYKNLRYMVINSTFRQDLLEILSQKNISFLDYVQELLVKRKKQTTHEKDSYATIEKKVILELQELVSVMTTKYGSRTAKCNLEDFLKTGNPSRITRDNDLRNRIVNSSFRFDLKNILDKRNISLEDYIRVVSSVSIEPKEIFLEQAIMETYNKYENLHLNGNCEYGGFDYAVSAVIQLAEKNSYKGFTRDNGARDNLMINVTKDDILKIISKDSGIEYSPNKNYTHDEIELLAEQYVTRFLEVNKNKSL